MKEQAVAADAMHRMTFNHGEHETHASSRRRGSSRVRLFLSLLLLSSLLFVLFVYFDTPSLLQLTVPVHAYYLEFPQLNFADFNVSAFSAEQLKDDLFLRALREKKRIRLLHTAATYSPQPQPLILDRPLVILDPAIHTGVGQPELCAPLTEGTVDVHPEVRQELWSEASDPAYVSTPEADEKWPLLPLQRPLLGSILVASRGNCAFAEKSYWAQHAGASALIVTNSWDEPDDAPDPLERMGWSGVEGEFGEFLRQHTDEDPANFRWTMPSYFMFREDLNQLVRPVYKYNMGKQQLLQRRILQARYPDGVPMQPAATSPSAEAEAAATPASSTAAINIQRHATMRRLLQSVVSSTGMDESSSSSSGSSGGGGGGLIPSPDAMKVWTFLPLHAVFGEDNDAYDELGPDYSKYRLAALFLLILPALWLLTALVYMIRRACVRYHLKEMRKRRETFLPIVKWMPISNNESDAHAAPSPSGSSPVQHENGNSTSGPHPQSQADQSSQIDRAVEMVPVNGTTTQHPRQDGHDADSGSKADEIDRGRDHGRARDGDGDDDGNRRARSRSPDDEATMMSSAAARILRQADDEDAARQGDDDHPVAATSGSSSASGSRRNSMSGVGVDQRGRHHRITGNACAICLCDFEQGEQLKLLPCAHGMHVPCLDPWLEGHDECPVCRAGINQVMPAYSSWLCGCCLPAHLRDPSRSAASPAAGQPDAVGAPILYPDVSPFPPVHASMAPHPHPPFPVAPIRLHHAQFQSPFQWHPSQEHQHTSNVNNLPYSHQHNDRADMNVDDDSSGQSQSSPSESSNSRSVQLHQHIHEHNHHRHHHHHHHHHHRSPHSHSPSHAHAHAHGHDPYPCSTPPTTLQRPDSDTDTDADSAQRQFTGSNSAHGSSLLSARDMQMTFEDAPRRTANE